ncbi:hypothetical protein Bca4012_030880 [Brassica carinata]|uniref:Uncharacterized protein n=1 Tax=Brassica carinata TaxID=52824 RepID=A0A8X7RI01_BRACI|nr:hypothetical protein Bca52824_047841 [Brassica carinata]
MALIPEIGRDSTPTSIEGNIRHTVRKDRNHLLNGGLKRERTSSRPVWYRDREQNRRQDRQLHKPRYKEPLTEWRPVQRSTKALSDRASVRLSEQDQDRDERRETEEERRRRIKGKGLAVEDAEPPRPKTGRLSETALLIRDQEPREANHNQLDQNHASKIHIDNTTVALPLTEAVSEDKHEKTQEKRKEREEDDISMEEGEFNKMVDYYNELGMSEEMIEEDDLLDDIAVPETQEEAREAAEYGNEQIEAIAQLGRKETPRTHASEARQNTDEQTLKTLPKEVRSGQETQRGLSK